MRKFYRLDRRLEQSVLPHPVLYDGKSILRLHHLTGQLPATGGCRMPEMWLLAKETLNVSF